MLSTYGHLWMRASWPLLYKVTILTSYGWHKVFVWSDTCNIFAHGTTQQMHKKKEVSTFPKYLISFQNNKVVEYKAGSKLT